MLIRKQIHDEAKRLGFAACGVTHVHTVADEAMAHLDAWLADGGAAGMEYMHNYREIRRDPTLLLPGAKTIVCLAMGYTPREAVAGFAHYAYGRDYHEVVRLRAKALADTFATVHRVCVDTAPILERYWAQEAGVGWIGRNRQLIVPHAGSEFFLCEILFADEVDETDKAVKARCGSCHRCMDACPTGALGGDGRLDARRCNSYLTIEHRGEWTDHRPTAGCLYGCDECQRACPWQRFATATEEPDFQPGHELLAMKAEDWQSLTREQFGSLFRHSAVKRTKYEGLMRNIETQTR